MLQQWIVLFSIFKTANCCNFVDKSSVSSLIVGDGYHKTVEISGNGNFGIENGRILCVLRPTKNYYIDLDQAKNNETESNVKVKSSSKVQVELNSLDAEYFSAIAEYKLEKHVSDFHFSFNIHLRYQPPVGSERYLEIDHPLLDVFFLPDSKDSKLLAMCNYENVEKSFSEVNNEPTTMKAIHLRKQHGMSPKIKVPIGALSALIKPLTVFVVLLGSYSFCSSLRK